MEKTNLPTNPGCYIFKDKNNKIIYIGKAKNLKKRVNSYFQKNHPDTKTQLLVKEIKKIDYIITDTETEALILENNLIKKNKPKYNIDLKDSKKYAYLQITDETYPRLIIARKKQDKGNYFGPFTCAASRDHIFYTLKKLYKLRTCKKMPKKPCLRLSIGLCSGPCINNITQQEYEQKIKEIKLILSGKTTYLIKQLKKQMQQHSLKKDYEKAIQDRETITSLKELSEKQKMERTKQYNEDIINYTLKQDKIYLMLFNVDKGTIINKQEYIFEYAPYFFEEFLLQYYLDNKIPKSIILPQSINKSLKEVLEKKAKHKIKIELPKIGEKRQLLELVKKNIEITHFSQEKSLTDIKEKLQLKNSPEIIECFDISHLSGTLLVGSMVRFTNAKPDKTNYRRFKLKTFTGNDDTRAIAEIVFRRYYKLKTNQEPLPGLVVIDGGRGQLNSAKKQLTKLKLNIPVVSLAKKQEEIYTTNNHQPLKLPTKSEAQKLLQRIRDEAHRFAINYNKLLRKKEMIGNDSQKTI